MSRISDDVRRRVRERAGNRCGYCLSPQHLVLGWLEIEHIIPVARGGSDEEENLWLSCRLCNNFKSTQVDALDPDTNSRVRLFDPRRQDWWEHFEWSEEGIRILAKTPCGRATILALHLNHFIAVTVRREWVKAGWHPPQRGSAGLAPSDSNS